MKPKTIPATVWCPQCNRTYQAKITIRWARKRHYTLGFPRLVCTECLNRQAMPTANGQAEYQE